MFLLGTVLLDICLCLRSFIPSKNTFICTKLHCYKSCARGKIQSYFFVSLKDKPRLFLPKNLFIQLWTTTVYDFYSMLFDFSLKLSTGLLPYEKVISGQACERKAGHVQKNCSYLMFSRIFMRGFSSKICQLLVVLPSDLKFLLQIVFQTDLLYRDCD